LLLLFGYSACTLIPIPLQGVNSRVDTHEVDAAIGLSTPEHHPKTNRPAVAIASRRTMLFISS
jgi:hypothetical protein